MAFEDSTLAVDDLGDTDGQAVTIGGRSLLVFRVGDQVYATQRACLHQGGDLADGIVIDGAIVCPLHGWRFDIRSGIHADSPYNCLRTYPVEVRDGRVYVDPSPNPLPEVPK